MATENAAHNFNERQRTQKNAQDNLSRLQARLRLPRLPRRIECFDISTFQGELSVGSQVVFTDGEPDKSQYRLFRVRGEAAADDFASMFQVLTRRLLRGLEQKDLPDLLVVDGGKGQLNVARAALKEAGLTLADVPLAGLAKSRVLEDERRFAARQGFSLAAAWEEKAGPEPEVPQIAPDDAEVGQQEAAAQGPGDETAAGSPPAPLAGRSRKKGRFVKDEIERSPERVFLPGQKNPLVLRQNTSEMFLLQRLRDEAHRFAITFHRKLRRERNFRSVLEEIPGIGDKRKRALLAHFGSLKRIRAAGIEEIAGVPGFNAQLGERVHRFLSAEGAAKAAEAEAREAASGAADDADPQSEVREESEVAAASAVAMIDRDDVAFDAAQAELEALEDAEVPDLADEADSGS
jgi:excinuclease ABC subunit C